MRDDIHALIDVLRVKSDGLPDGFTDAPILDEWEFKQISVGDALYLTGCCSGDDRFRAGAPISTSEIRQVDGRASIRWVRTRNTLYRLGAPAFTTPLVAAIALADDWMDALILLALLTGEHTLDGLALETYKQLLDLANVHDWSKKRGLARGIAAAMELAGRFGLEKAWMLLGADPSDRADARYMRDLLRPALERAGGDKAKPVLAAWDALASDNFGIAGDEHDHIAMSHRAGRELLARKNSSRPLFVRVALCRTWREAADLLLAALRPDDRNKADLLMLTSPQWLCRRVSARSMADRLRTNGEEDFARCFELLAVEPLSSGDAAWVVSNLNEHVAAGNSHEEDALMAGWRRLAESKPPKAGEGVDPFATAWIASAERTDTEMELGDASNETDPAGDLPSEPSPAEPPGIVVLPRLGGTSVNSSGKEAVAEFKSIVGERLPLFAALDLTRVRTILIDEFPHVAREIDMLMTGLIDGAPIRLPPTLLVGEPGGGKSRLARRLAEELQVPLHRFDGSGSSDSAFAGTPRRWSSGEHSVPLEAVRRAHAPNPFLLIEEVDKAGTSRRNGSLDRALLPFLEPENSRAFPDPYIQAEVDLSHVNYLLTANDATLLPVPLRDRLRIITLPPAAIEYLPQLARTVVADIAQLRGGDARWFPPLEDTELAIAESLWRGGSLRRLRAIVDRILARREQNPRN